MVRKKKMLTTYVTQDQWYELHLLSERTRIPMAVHVREAIDLILDLNKPGGPS